MVSLFNAISIWVLCNVDIASEGDVREYEFLEKTRWKGSPHCPHCGCERVYKMETLKRYKCANNECYKQFNVLTGTIFANTKIDLGRWFCLVIWYHFGDRVSTQLARELELTQKTSWINLQKLKRADECQSFFSNPINHLAEARFWLDNIVDYLIEIIEAYLTKFRADLNKFDDAYIEHLADLVRYKNCRITPEVIS